MKYLSGERVRITSRARFTSVTSRLFADGRNRDLSFSLASVGYERIDIGPRGKAQHPFERYSLSYTSLCTLPPLCRTPVRYPFATPICQTQGWRENSYSTSLTARFQPNDRCVIKQDPNISDFRSYINWFNSFDINSLKTQRPTFYNTTRFG